MMDIAATGTAMSRMEADIQYAMKVMSAAKDMQEMTGDMVSELLSSAGSVASAGPRIGQGVVSAAGVDIYG